MVPHRGAKGRAITVCSTPWPSTCSGALPSWCTIEVAAWLAFTEEAAIHDAPGRLSHTCIDSAEESTGITLRMRGYYSSGVREATQRTARHSLQNASLLRGQKVANYHVWRQPWTPDSLTLVSEMTDQKSLHRACNRHLSMVGLFLLLVCENQHQLLSLLSGFTTCHRGIQ